MSASPPRNTGVSPSPRSLFFLLLILPVFLVGMIYFFRIGLTAQVSPQTGASINNDPLDDGKVARPILIAQATETVDSRPTDDSGSAPPTVVLVYETDLPPYIPGPTAQFTEIVPLDQWLTYTDEKAGYTIKYPPDWYTSTTPADARIFGSTTELYSYDINDPNLVIRAKSGESHPNYTRFEITTIWNLEATNSIFLPDEDIVGWARRNRSIGPEQADVQRSLEEREIEVGGKQAYLQVVALTRGGVINSIYVKNGDSVVFIYFPVESPGGFNEEVLQRILSTLVFTK